MTTLPLSERMKEMTDAELRYLGTDVNRSAMNCNICSHGGSSFCSSWHAPFVAGDIVEKEWERRISSNQK